MQVDAISTAIATFRCSSCQCGLSDMIAVDNDMSRCPTTLKCGHTRCKIHDGLCGICLQPSYPAEPAKNVALSDIAEKGHHDNQLHCFLCHEIYNSYSCLPTTLQCGHTICMQDLPAYKKRFAECYCHSTTPLPSKFFRDELLYSIVREAQNEDDRLSEAETRVVDALRNDEDRAVVMTNYFQLEALSELVGITVAEAGVIPMLIGTLTSTTTTHDERKRIVQDLLYLTWLNQKYLEEIVDEDGLPVIVLLLDDAQPTAAQSVESKRAVAQLLNRIAVDSNKGREALLATNVAELLLPLIQAEVVHVLEALRNDEDRAVVMTNYFQLEALSELVGITVAEAGVIPMLIGTLTSTTTTHDERKRIVQDLLYLTWLNQKYLEEIVDEDGLPVIVLLLDDAQPTAVQGVESKRAVAQLLNRIAVDSNKGREALLATNVAELLLPLTQDRAVRKEAARALASITAPDGRMVGFEDVAALINIINNVNEGEDKVVCALLRLRCWVCEGERVQNLVVEVLDPPTIMLLLLRPPTTRAASFALIGALISDNAATLGAFIAVGLVPAALARLNSKEPSLGLAESILTVVACAAALPEGKAALVDFDKSEYTLVGELTKKRGSTTTRSSALRVLGLLSEGNPPYQTRLFRARGISEFVELLSVRELSFASAWALCRVAHGNMNVQEKFVNAGAVIPLVAMLSVGASMKMRIIAAKALGTLAANAFKCHKRIAEAGAIPHLVTLAATFEHPYAFKFGTFALNMLLKSDVLLPAIASAALIELPALTAALINSSPARITESLKALVYFSRIIDTLTFTNAIVAVVAPLLNLVFQGQGEQVNDLIRLLQFVARGNVHQQQALLNVVQNAGNSLIGALQSRDSGMRRRVVGLLATLSAELDVLNNWMYDSGAVPHLLNILVREGASEHTQSCAATILLNMATSCEIILVAITLQASPLIRIAQDGLNSDTVEDVIDALRTLGWLAEIGRPLLDAIVSAPGLIEEIVGHLQVGRDEYTCYTALWALAQLAADNLAIQDTIAAHGGLAATSALLNNDFLAQKAVWALGIFICGNKNLQNELNDSIPTMVQFLCDADQPILITAADTLSIVADFGPENQEAIIHAGAVPLLFALLRERHDSTTIHAGCRLLNALAWKNCALQGQLTADVLPAAVALIDFVDSELRSSVLDLTRCLAHNHTVNRTALIEAGIVPMLTQHLLSSGDSKEARALRIAAAGALGELVKEVTLDKSMIKSLVERMRPALFCESYARVLYAVARNHEVNLRQFTDVPGAVSSLLLLLESDYAAAEDSQILNLWRVICRHNCCTQEHNKSALTALCGLLSSESPFVANHSASIIAAIVDGTELQHSSQAANCISPLVIMLARKQSRGSAAEALAALACNNDTNICLIVQAEGGHALQLLVEMLANEGGCDSDDLEDAITAIAFLCTNQKSNQNTVADNHVFPTLVRVLSSHDVPERVRGSAALALGNIAGNNVRTLTEIFQCGGVDALLAALQSDRPELLEHGLWALSKFTQQKAYRSLVCNKLGAIHSIAAMLSREASENLKLHAVNILSDIARDDVLRDHARDAVNVSVVCDLFVLRHNLPLCLSASSLLLGVMPLSGAHRRRIKFELESMYELQPEERDEFFSDDIVQLLLRKCE